MKIRKESSSSDWGGGGRGEGKAQQVIIFEPVIRPRVVVIIVDPDFSDTAILLQKHSLGPNFLSSSSSAPSSLQAA